MTFKEGICLLCNGGNGGESHAINIAAFREGCVGVSTFQVIKDCCRLQLRVPLLLPGGDPLPVHLGRLPRTLVRHSGDHHTHCTLTISYTTKDTINPLNNFNMANSRHEIGTPVSKDHNQKGVWCLVNKDP